MASLLSLIALFGLLGAGAQSLATIGNDAIATGAAPGIAMAVVRHGEIVYEAGFGYADVAAKVSVTARTRFALGSLTKQLTAAAILMLVGDGKLSLGDYLAKYVPSLPNANRITLRMLLDQDSGLHNYPELTEHAWPTSGSIPLSRIIAILATDKPDFAPGTKWEYSNANYAALAAVVEKVSGIPLGQFLRTRIFNPLHMQDSGFGYDAQQTGGLAVGYVGDKAETPALSLDLFSGAGGAVSSAHDLALWDIALLRGTLLLKGEVAQMWQSGVLTAGSGSDRYSMGWMLTQLANHREVWHNGLAPGAGGYCYNAIFPDDGLAVVVLTNGFSAQGLPERMTQEVAAAYGIGSPPPPQAATTPAPGDDPAIDSLARAFWNQLASGNIDRTKVTPQVSAALTPQVLQQVEQGMAIMGEPTSFVFAGKSEESGLTIYRYELSFPSGVQHEWDFVLTADGKIAGSHIVR